MAEEIKDKKVQVSEGSLQALIQSNKEMQERLSKLEKGGEMTLDELKKIREETKRKNYYLRKWEGKYLIKAIKSFEQKNDNGESVLMFKGDFLGEDGKKEEITMPYMDLLRLAEKIKFTEDIDVKIETKEDEKLLGFVEKYQYKTGSTNSNGMTMTDSPVSRVATGEVVPNVIVTKIQSFKFKIFDKWIDVDYSGI